MTGASRGLSFRLGTALPDPRSRRLFVEEVRQALTSLGIEEVVIAPRSPCQSPHVERLIGSIRRDSLDHVKDFNERHLLRLLKSYLGRYYHPTR